ncbi:unnamed protein product [Ascophyllum nodosum]
MQAPFAEDRNNDEQKEEEVRAMWLPSTVVRPDRGKATAVWLILLLGFVGYILYLGLNARDMRNNPPVKIQIKEEPFQFPDVVFCPAPGDGCDSENAIDCSTMEWKVSELQVTTHFYLSICNLFDH